jgi:hypothetical protein
MTTLPFPCVSDICVLTLATDVLILTAIGTGEVPLSPGRVPLCYRLYTGFREDYSSRQPSRVSGPFDIKDFSLSADNSPRSTEREMAR